MALTILVAQGDFIEAADLRDTCEEAGYHVEGPHPGICAAMLAMQKERPDLAILDLRLENGTALALAQKLRDENVPIIFHADAACPDDVAARFPGAANLAMPCPPAQFIDTIHRMLAPR